MRTRANVPLMALSLLISLVLWFVVIARDLPTEKSLPNKLQVKLEGDDSDNWYVDNAPASIPLGIQVPGDHMQEVDQLGPVEAEVDISHPTAGTSRYQVHVNPSWLREYLLDKHPSVSLRLEPMRRVQMRVEVQLTGQLQDSTLRLQPSTPVPSMANVTAPASMFPSAPGGPGITRVIARLDQSQVDPKNVESMDLDLQAVDKNGVEFHPHRINPPSVSVTPIVAPAPVTGTALVIPQIVGAPAMGFLPRDRDWEPTAVQITGDPTILEKTTRILTEPIDVNGLTADKVFHVRLKVPPQIQVMGPRTVTFTYRVAPDPSYHPGSRPSSRPSAGNAFPSTVPPLNGAKGGGP